MKSIRIYILIVPIIVLLFTISARTMNPMPRNAIIYINEREKIYISPPCYEGGDYTSSEKILWEDKGNIRPDFKTLRFNDLVNLNRNLPKGSKIRRDNVCNKNQGYEEHITLFESFLFGGSIISGRRWNRDGSWNW